MRGHDSALGSFEGGRRPRRSKFRLYRGLVILVGLAMVTVVVPFALNRYDTIHRLDVQCSVTSATALTVSSVNRKGLGRSSAEVEITTSDCGRVLLQQGDLGTSVRKTARALDAGGQYVLRVGEGAYNLRSLLNAIGRDVTADQFEKVG